MDPLLHLDERSSGICYLLPNLLPAVLIMATKHWTPGLSIYGAHYADLQPRIGGSGV